MTDLHYFYCVHEILRWQNQFNPMTMMSCHIIAVKPLVWSCKMVCPLSMTSTKATCSCLTNPNVHNTAGQREEDVFGIEVTKDFTNFHGKHKLNKHLAFLYNQDGKNPRQSAEGRVRSGSGGGSHPDIPTWDHRCNLRQIN